MGKDYLCGLLAVLALGLLSRLPHPARDISKLDPVQTIALSMEQGQLRIETDTGDVGLGADLPAAAEAMKQNADREIYLETAEFLVLTPDVPVTEDFFALLRPSAKVSYMAQTPELSELTPYLEQHPPRLTLNRLRAGETP